MDWSSQTAPSLDDFEELAARAFESLPEEFRALTGDVVFIVQDFPAEDVIRDMELDSEFEILGLFQGPELSDRVANRGHPDPTMVLLYRRPILDYWAEHEEMLGDMVRHVLVHEIGHHFGLSDEQMDAIEGAAE
ncbi:MAG: metallopeptidase family protein [Rhizomicrobium sp.]|jgi:predicted Zn-dependent protease with MMP-like domain